MQDENVSPIYECNVWDKGHVMQFDQANSNAQTTVYTCACGAMTIENEDGRGA